MKDTKNNKRRSMNQSDIYQFTVRIPVTVKVAVEKRVVGTGFLSLAEYIRHLIMEDIDGYTDTK